MTCREASALLSDSMEHPLPWHRTLWLRLHLVICRHCRNYRQNLRILQRIVRRYLAWKSRQRLSEEAKRRIRLAMKEEM